MLPLAFRPFSRLSRSCVGVLADVTFGNYLGRQKVSPAIFRGRTTTLTPSPPAALEAFLASGTVFPSGGEGHAAVPKITLIADRKIKSALKGGRDVP